MWLSSVIPGPVQNVRAKSALNKIVSTTSRQDRQRKPRKMQAGLTQKVIKESVYEKGFAVSPMQFAEGGCKR